MSASDVNDIEEGGHDAVITYAQTLMQIGNKKFGREIGEVLRIQ